VVRAHYHYPKSTSLTKDVSEFNGTALSRVLGGMVPLQVISFSVLETLDSFIGDFGALFLVCIIRPKYHHQ
jgi:hypothetical protein